MSLSLLKFSEDLLPYILEFLWAQYCSSVADCQLLQLSLDHGIFEVPNREKFRLSSTFCHELSQLLFSFHLKKKKSQQFSSISSIFSSVQFIPNLDDFLQ